MMDQKQMKTLFTASLESLAMWIETQNIPIYHSKWISSNLKKCFYTSCVDCSIATASAKHNLYATRRKYTVSNSRKSRSRLFITDLKHSTTQYTFKSRSAGLTKHIKVTKNEEKERNSSNASLFISALFTIQLPGSRKWYVQMGVSFVT